jgi:DNA-binding protein H-NS
MKAALLTELGEKSPGPVALRAAAEPSNGPAQPGKKRGAPKGRVSPLKGTKAPIKYRGPNGETWTGRGRTPTWLTDLESKGKKRERFAV